MDLLDARDTIFRSEIKRFYDLAGVLGNISFRIRDNGGIDRRALSLGGKILEINLSDVIIIPRSRGSFRYGSRLFLFAGASDASPQQESTAD